MIALAVHRIMYAQAAEQSLDMMMRVKRMQVLRADWMNAGMIWWSTSTTQPHRWDPLSQLKNVDHFEGHPRDSFERSEDPG